MILETKLIFQKSAQIKERNIYYKKISNHCN